MAVALYKTWGKRTLDICVAVPCLLLLAPLFALVGVLVAVLDGRPILFRQVRCGFRGNPFHVTKFRTMTVIDGTTQFSDGEVSRMTRLGKLLRRLSLDEIPQFWQVVVGHMSLVGPRPLPSDYQPFYTKRQWQRHDVKPGLTGWSQIHGRNARPWRERLELDVWYVEHQSFLLDLKIIWRTLLLVAKGTGVNDSTGGTPPPFRGDSFEAGPGPLPRDEVVEFGIEEDKD